MNNKIVSTKTTIAFFLAIVLVTGTIAISSSSSFMKSAQAQPSYYSYDGGMDYNNYKTSKDSFIKNKIKCINTNLNINGNNAGNVSIGNKKGQGYQGANSYDGGEGYYNDGYGNNKQGKGFDDCVINNNNTNTNIISVGGNQTVLPEEPERPTTATLTVNKQVFGCDNIETIPPDSVFIVCAFQNNDPNWISCDDSDISDTIFCQALPENIFDIQVLDDQNNQIEQFEGSAQGTTIENLEPSTYTVQEIKHASSINQLGEEDDSNDILICDNLNFPDVGQLFNTNPNVGYDIICFEYEDEQGNDCSTITLAAGESRTCTVKNYIINAAGFSPPV